MGYTDFFADKRVTLMGLGLLGRGVGDAEFLAPLCKELVVTDQKPDAELVPSLERLKKFANVRFVGAHKKEDFTNTDMVIKAAGVPLGSPYIAAARAAGVPVYMSTALFAQFARDAGATLVGVTGTRGKSTVAALIHHTLQLADKPSHLGGNIRGLSTLAMLPTVHKGDIVVMELDSWQLQGFGDLKISPDIAVFTNLMPDHMNYYGGNMEKYFEDKANIFRFQREGAVLVNNPNLADLIRPLRPTENVFRIQPHSPVPQGWCSHLVGEHNLYNAALAVEALGKLGLSESQIREGLTSFEPVEGRLQFVREINGVKIYNDNNATTPEATLAALASFVESKVILIAGGADKDLDKDVLQKEMQKCKKVLLLAGSGTEKIKGDFVVYQNISDALHAALESAVAGDAILFSPAFASFGMFKNEYDRNDQFLSAVAKLA